VALELKHEQQQAAVWQQLLQSLPQPAMTTPYMAQRELQLGCSWACSGRACGHTMSPDAAEEARAGQHPDA
jgi:hypothetical protein